MPKGPMKKPTKKRLVELLELAYNQKIDEYGWLEIETVLSGYGILKDPPNYTTVTVKVQPAVNVDFQAL